MALEQYVEKRHLDKTPEPAGGEPSSGLPTFVVQLHRATRLHYDFRLEVNGVLASWAVPKGPSTNPQDKRLAMMVEDHPMDYRRFEGIIPKGSYGAGTVMVWDEGTYAAPDATTREEVDHAINLGLHKGHAAFFLSGHKLKGLFDLIKLKGREENAWLLVKRPDEFASTEDVTKNDRSVISGRTLDEIKMGAPSSGQVWYSDRIAESIDLSDAPEGAMPRKVKPMLASEVDHPFDRPGWLFEVKWDGYRAIAEVELEGEVKLYSRNQLSFNERYHSIIKDLKKLGRACVLDGEVVVIDDEGRSQFQWLQDYAKGKKGTLLYYAFDLLYLDGHDLRMLPLKQRKGILERIIPPESRIRFSGHVEERGCDFYEAVTDQALEGMMAKNAASPYEEGRRSREWLKVKHLLQQDVVIGGYTEPRNSRKHFGALVLGVCEDDDLVYVGHTGGGFNEAGLESLLKKLEPLKRETSPFREPPKTNMPVTWVEPKIVCRVTFRGWTESGNLRQPVFFGMCPNVDVDSVRRTQTTHEQGDGESGSPETREGSDSRDVARFPAKARDQMLEIDGQVLKLTNLDKVFWPDEGYTKGNLIDYYRGVAQFILPYLKDRPESLHRHPNGVGQKGFFQKDMPRETPGWTETVEVFSPSNDKKIRYLLCQNEATLIYMANLACIEINPWNTRLPTLDRPDYSVIDLDPYEVGFDAVIESALKVRKVLEEIEVPSYPKTSGASGLHVYVPLGAKYGYDQSKQFAELIAQLVHARLPKITSLERMPARRIGKVYLDFLQNRDGQTLASAYSARPKPGATVSTPLKWEEVGKNLDPKAFTIRTIVDRLEKLGDLWEPVLGPGIDMVKALEAIQTKLEA